MRDGFIIHEKTMRMARRLEPEDVGYLFWCLANYYEDGEIDLEKVSEVSVAVAIILEDALERMDADAEAYEKLSVDRSEAGKKGAEKRWHSHEGGDAQIASDSKAIATDGKAMANDSKAMANDSKHMANDSDSVSVIKENLSPKGESQKKAAAFHPPTAEEVRAYCQERGNRVDPEHFVDFYTSKGWKVGNQPMKDWKACVRTWERKDAAPPGKVRPIRKGYEERSYDFDAIEREAFAAMMREG